MHRCGPHSPGPPRGPHVSSEPGPCHHTGKLSHSQQELQKGRISSGPGAAPGQTLASEGTLRFCEPHRPLPSPRTLHCTPWLHGHLRISHPACRQLLRHMGPHTDAPQERHTGERACAGMLQKCVPPAHTGHTDMQRTHVHTQEWAPEGTQRHDGSRAGSPTWASQLAGPLALSAEGALILWEDCGNFATGGPAHAP